MDLNLEVVHAPPRAAASVVMVRDTARDLARCLNETGLGPQTAASRHGP